MPDSYLFALPAPPALDIVGKTVRFAIRRIFCVGRNYAAHALELGNEVDRQAPFYFTKSAHALCPSGSTIALPSQTADCHYEMECVVALGAEAHNMRPDQAMGAVWGYGCGIDLTRRDLQSRAKEKRRPWDVAKDFDNAAILGALTPVADVGPPGAQAIWLDHDGVRVQEGRLSDMIWSVPEIIADLSRFYRLMPGDLIMTGTPAGVGPVHPGSVLQGGVTGLAPVRVRFAQDQP